MHGKAQFLEAQAAVPRRLALLLALFLLVNLALLAATVPGANLEHGADAASWLAPAKALLKHGAFVEYQDPSLPQIFRQPLYPLFVAGFLWLGDGETVLPVILAQIALLFATGVFVRGMVELWLPGYGDLAMALAIFNPNAVGTAHLLQSDTLYAFLIAGVLWAVLAYARRPGFKPALLCGLSLGLACLVRPMAQYVILALPVALPALGWAGGHGGEWVRQAKAGLAAAVVAGAVLLPWMIHNYEAGQGFQLSAPALRSAYIWDNLPYLHKYSRDVSLEEAGREIGAVQEDFIARQQPAWAELTERERHERLIGHGLEVLFAYPPGDIAEAYLWSWVQLFGIPGVGNLHNLLGLTTRTPFDLFFKERHPDFVSAGLAALEGASLPTLAVSVLGFVYVLALRGAGLFGLAVMVARRQWPVLAVTVGVIAYFALIYLFVGNSRYRLPVEPLLILLAVYGLDGLKPRR